MATLNTENPFQAWVLTPEELTQGTILTTLQKQCIQNQICATMIALNNMIFDPEKPIQYAQEQAEKRGTISALQYLIDLSNTAEASLTQPPQE